MTNELQEILALRDRLDVFLPKLKQRCQEFGEDSKKEAAEMRADQSDEGKQSFGVFTAAVIRQIMAVGTKAERTFAQHFEKFEDTDNDAVDAEYKRSEQRVDAFLTWLETYTDHLFDDGCGDEAEQMYQQALRDYEQLKNSFTCSQCGAPVPVDKMYYTSQYLTCLGCETQTTFTPTEAMQSLPRLAEDLADSRTKHLEKELDDLVLKHNLYHGEILVRHVNYLLAQYRVMHEILPEYAEQKRHQFITSAVVEATQKAHTDLEPAGTLIPDVSYVNVIGGFGDGLILLRQDNDTLIAALLEDIVRALARPGDGLAEAVLANTYNNEVWEQYAAIAQQSPQRESYNGL
ncbi:MAG: hypothetical protein Q4D85_02875 [Corynebacterium sp.]|uniref:hypothetical protein n=1 Tax=Corynebacterium sp. TaxID=1720 RepID=UPI0026DC916E|nr:hypothetical protein [Corynebacterium sp.]MDO5097674.1 hypothetical protein [Corynebacterium sp.]